MGALLGREERDRRLGHAGEAVGPVSPVDLERRRPEQLGELASRHPARRLQLEHPLAGGEEALDPDGVVDRLRGDRGDASVVEGDGDRGGEARDRRGLAAGAVAGDDERPRRRDGEEDGPGRDEGEAEGTAREHRAGRRRQGTAAPQAQEPLNWSSHHRPLFDWKQKSASGSSPGARAGGEVRVTGRKTGVTVPSGWTSTRT